MYLCGLNLRSIGEKFSLIFFLLVFGKIYSQNVIAYTDNLGYFSVFDNGITTTLDYQKPKSFQIGGNSVAYVDFNASFKVYYKGKDTTLYDGPVNEYRVMHSMVFYVIAGQLRVFDRGRNKTLSVWPGDYAVGDSLVAFYDNTYRAFYVYYNHDMFTLENNTQQNPLVNFRASDNTLAYINNQRDFKIFWNGSVQKIFTLSPGFMVDYQTGSNIVAFLSGPSNSLSAFYKGNTYNISKIPIKSYKTADEMVAYEDQDGLHAFYAGKNYDLCSSYSITYDISDSILVYYTPGYFRVFNKGKITVLENFMPDEYAIDNNTLAWTNQQGGLRVFYNGEIYELTTFDRAAFKLAGNALWYQTVTIPNKVFLCGRKY